MFYENKYTVIYYSIIASAEGRSKTEFYERHHIIPKSLGGSDDVKNLIFLTYREHFIVHWLLVKMCIDAKHKKSMQYAFWNMTRRSGKHSRTFTAKQYETAKRHHAQAVRGENNPMFGKKRPGLNKGSDNPFFGKTHSDEYRIRKSAMMTGAGNSKARAVIVDGIHHFGTMKEAAKYLGVSKPTVRAMMQRQERVFPA